MKRENRKAIKQYIQIKLFPPHFKENINEQVKDIHYVYLIFFWIQVKHDITE